MQEILSEYEARQLVRAAGIETGDDPRSYVEIAAQFKLALLPSAIELTLPEAESKV